MSLLSLLGVFGVIYYFLSNFSMKFLWANRIAPDGMPCSAASHLGLCCLPMSHKKRPGIYELIRFKHLSVGVIFTKASLMSDLNGSLKQIFS